MKATSHQKTMPDIAHQKQIKDKMAKEDAWNLFGEWWKDIDIDIKKAIVTLDEGNTIDTSLEIK